MNPLTLEWIEKAEGDFLTAGRELRVRKHPNYDAVCFHAQQCSEKYLKAILQEQQQIIPKVHSLADLIALCVTFQPTLNLLQPELMVLEEYAVQFRYPGRSADKQEAFKAMKAVIVVRKLIRQLMTFD